MRSVPSPLLSHQSRAYFSPRVKSLPALRSKQERANMSKRERVNVLFLSIFHLPSSRNQHLTFQFTQHALRLLLETRIPGDLHLLRLIFFLLA